MNNQSASRDQEAQLQIDAVDRHDFGSALRIAKSSITEPVIMDALSFNSSGILINVGGQKRDLELIELGMRIARGFIDNQMCLRDYLARARYNLSNGYAALAQVCEQKKDYEGRNANWKLQRDELQVLVLDRNSVPQDMVTEVLTNFGNVLDELGRTIEAIDIWNQVVSINPDHPVALGSMGQAYLRLFEYSART